MKFIFPEINGAIKIKPGVVNSLAIENPRLLYAFVSDLKKQTEKQSGETVFSVKDEPQEIHRYVDVVTDAYSMDLNARNIITKVVDELSKKAVNEVHYEKTMQLIASFETYIGDLVWDEECEIMCSEITPKQLIKAADVMIVDGEISLSERVIKYVEVIRQFIGERLFVFVNFRGFIEQKDFEIMVNTMLEHGFNMLFIDNREYDRITGENRKIIDIDLCEF